MPRTGWLDRGVPPAEAESVADHSFRLAILTWLAALLPGAALDADRVLKLALIHDLAESLTGDEPPYDAATIPPAEEIDARRRFLQQRHIRDPARTAAKRAAEEVAMATLLAELPAPIRGEIESLWAEYQAQSTAEAVFVKQADRLETYLQAQEYLAADPDRPMSSFAAEVAEAIAEPRLQRLRDEVTGWKQTSDEA
jgi:putative hydrolase of HD superfamily